MFCLNLLKKDSKTFFCLPNIDEVMMVEDLIKKHCGEYKKKELFKQLTIKLSYSQFCIILDYLFYLKKISMDLEGKIGWIYNPKLVSKYIDKVELGRNQ
jgi:hypothetical protein